MQLLPSSFCLISAQTHPFDLCPHYFTILLLSGARYHIPDIIFHEIFTKNAYIWWYNISDIRVRGQKPRCACTGVVSWLPDPPKYEHKSEASALRYANIWQDCESAKHGTIRMISRNSHYEHKSEASALRYANIGQDCESAKHGTIRMISRNSHYEHKSEASGGPHGTKNTFCTISECL